MPADRSYPTRSYLFAGSESTATKPPPTTDAVDITRATRIVPATSRNASAVAEVEADAVLRVELENGFILWSRADDLLQERGKPLSQRDGETTWSLDFTPRPGQPARGGERGLLKLAVKVLDVFGINLRQKAASKLGEALEDREEKRVQQELEDREGGKENNQELLGHHDRVEEDLPGRRCLPFEGPTAGGLF